MGAANPGVEHSETLSTCALAAAGLAAVIGGSHRPPPLQWGWDTRPWRLSPEGRRGRTPGPRIMLPYGSVVQIAWWSTKVASLLAVGLRKTTQTIVTAV